MRETAVSPGQMSLVWARCQAACLPSPLQPRAPRRLTSGLSFTGRVEFFRLMLRSPVPGIPPIASF